MTKVHPWDLEKGMYELGDLVRREGTDVYGIIVFQDPDGWVFIDVLQIWPKYDPFQSGWPTPILRTNASFWDNITKGIEITQDEKYLKNKK